MQMKIPMGTALTRREDMDNKIISKTTMDKPTKKELELQIHRMVELVSGLNDSESNSTYKFIMDGTGRIVAEVLTPRKQGRHGQSS
jgi:hypothetical protein